MRQIHIVVDLCRIYHVFLLCGLLLKVVVLILFTGLTNTFIRLFMSTSLSFLLVLLFHLIQFEVLKLISYILQVDIEPLSGKIWRKVIRVNQTLSFSTDARDIIGNILKLDTSNYSLPECLRESSVVVSSNSVGEYKLGVSI